MRAERSTVSGGTLDGIEQFLQSSLGLEAFSLGRQGIAQPQTGHPH